MRVTANMADGIDGFLRGLPSLIRQASAHLLSRPDLNTLELYKRRLEDYYDTFSAIFLHCIEVDLQEDNNDNIVLQDLSLLHDRLLDILHQYNEFCQCSFDGGEPITLGERNIFHTEQRNATGRPSFAINEQALGEFYRVHNVWSNVARETGVSYRTLLRRRREFGMSIANTRGPRNTYSDVTEEQLCQVVREILQAMPDAGETYVIGALRSRGLTLQRWRVRQVIRIVDPISRAIRRTHSIVRRRYSVPCPNALW